MVMGAYTTVESPLFPQRLFWQTQDRLFCEVSLIKQSGLFFFMQLSCIDFLATVLSAGVVPQVQPQHLRLRENLLFV